VKRKTPPRPSPPRILAKANAKMITTGRRSLSQATEDEEEEPVPPRPPPPISYVSTLPPPVPKKTPSPRNGAAKYSAKTLPMRRVSMPKQKPLQRVQPLQVLQRDSVTRWIYFFKVLKIEWALMVFTIFSCLFVKEICFLLWNHLLVVKFLPVTLFRKLVPAFW
jgi:hypothetical protein